MNSTANLQQINHAMSFISFSDVLLDAALVEINESLTHALNGESTGELLADQELNRASAASAMALAGALFNLKDTEDLEELMLGVDFLDNDDLDEAKIVKGVMLDRLLIEKVSEAQSFEVEQVKKIQQQTAEILQRYGYAGQHFTARGAF